MTTNRRARGTGSVIQRPDGLWEARASIGYENGKRKLQPFYGTTKGGVERLLREALHELDRGYVPERVGTTVGRFLEGWLETGRAKAPAGDGGSLRADSRAPADPPARLNQAGQTPALRSGLDALPDPAGRAQSPHGESRLGGTPGGPGRCRAGRDRGPRRGQARPCAPLATTRARGAHSPRGPGGARCAARSRTPAARNPCRSRQAAAGGIGRVTVAGRRLGRW